MVEDLIGDETMFSTTNGAGEFQYVRVAVPINKSIAALNLARLAIGQTTGLKGTSDQTQTCLLGRRIGAGTGVLT